LGLEPRAPGSVRGDPVPQSQEGHSVLLDDLQRALS